MKVTNIIRKKGRRYIACKEIAARERAFDKRVRELALKDRKFARKDDVELTEEQKRAIDEFWKKYEFAYVPNYDTFKVYMNRTGKFDPRYIPHGLRSQYLEYYMTNPSYRTAFQNKAYLAKIYGNITQPVTVIRKIEGIYYDADYNKISRKKAIAICLERLKTKEIVIKPSGRSGGAGVVFLSEATEERLREEFKKIPGVLMVQEALTQHPFMQQLNPTTVNTVRVTTYLRKSQVVLLAAVVKVGSSGVRVDNYKHGGCILGIKEDGHSLPYALNVEMERVTTLPSGVDVSEGVDIPSFDKVVELAKKAHLQTPKMKLISWDIAIREDGKPVLIEANYGGAIWMHQLVTGPLFGEYTEEILDRYLLKKFYRIRANAKYTYREYADHIEITGCVGKKAMEKAPNEIHGKPVTKINGERNSSEEERQEK